jgi:hypothetical protein
MSRRRFGSVRRLPSGRWQVRYRTGDGRQHTAPETFATKTEATRHLAQVETDLGRLDGVAVAARLERASGGSLSGLAAPSAWDPGHWPGGAGPGLIERRRGRAGHGGRRLVRVGG